MKLFTLTFTLPLLGLYGRCTASSSNGQDMVYSFDNIQSSANLSWTPCFDNFTCSRLQVPLDHANDTIGTTSIAFIKFAGTKANATSQSIMILPGGPGGSGVQLLLQNAATADELFAGEYNIVSFDPRGVGNSGPNIVDCFYQKPEARQAFYSLHRTGVTNVSSTSFEEQYYSSSIYGDWCNHAVKTDFPYGYYVTTPAVARDLLSFIEAEASLVGQKPSTAKMWAYGFSYGTVTGATFASMFPNRIERMILDGVLDADMYYRNDYSANFDQMDEALASFTTFCYSAGPSKCSFWGPSPQNITARLDNMLTQFQNHPIPISGADDQSIPEMVTYSDFKALLVNPFGERVATSFPVLADALHQVEQGNMSALVGTYKATIGLSDTTLIIGCVDSYRTNSITSFKAYEDYAKHATKTSKYFGDIYLTAGDRTLCRAMQPQLPDSMVVQDTKVGTKTPTSFPIVFASNTIDPVTPLISAQKTSARFPGSVLLLQEGVGHTVALQGTTDCYNEHIRAYYQGKVPPTNTKCSMQRNPFIDSSV